MLLVFLDFWLHSKQDHHIQSCQHGQVNSGGSHDLGTFFFFPCVLIYCPSGKPSKVLNLVGTLASPCSDLYSVSLLKPLSHSTASLVKISRGHAEIKLETCWLCKWNIKMEFLKVHPLDPPFSRRGDLVCVLRLEQLRVLKHAKTAPSQSMASSPIPKLIKLLSLPKCLEAFKR